MTQFPIPKRVSLDDLKDIIKAYYVEGAHNNPVRTADVEDTAQLADRVGRQTPFLVSIGVLEKEGRQRILTEEGEDIAEALMGGNEEIARSRMRETITSWEFTSKIQGFVRMQGPVDDDQLSEYLSANIESSDDRGKRTLIDLFLWADILERSEEDEYVTSDGSAKPNIHEEGSEDSDDIPEPPSSPSLDQTESGNRNGKRSAEASIEIDFSFSAEDDPGDIEEVIEAVRRGLAAEIKMKDSSESASDNE